VNRLIYSYEFPDNAVYVGLTCDPIDRNYSHLSDKKSSVYRYILKTKYEPKFCILTQYLSVTDAKLQEENILNEYRIQGWCILNKIKTGGLGGNVVIWSKEQCLSEALKFKSRKEWSKKSSRSYCVALKHEWFLDCVKHMKRPSVHNKKWTLETCQNEALKYEKRSDWYLKSRSSYITAVRNKWIKLCDKHFNV
jgi:predicted GIY-YIG superfamily endonuclease